MMVKDLNAARILVTNDDGINAEGLAALEQIARSLSDEVWVVAPETEQSGAGHSLTLHAPIRARKLQDMRFAITGTPTDCVLMAAMQLATDKPFDLVLSGINRGANVAEDVTYSGTIAAAMEATLLNIPAIAFSMMVQEDITPNWQVAKQHAPQIIREVCALDWPQHCFMNLNFPGVSADNVRGVKICPHGRRLVAKDKLIRKQDPRGRDYYWIGGAGVEPYCEHPEADYHQLAAGFITLTPLSLDLTQYTFMQTMMTQLTCDV